MSNFTIKLSVIKRPEDGQYSHYEFDMSWYGRGVYCFVFLLLVLLVVFQ